MLFKFVCVFMCDFKCGSLNLNGARDRTKRAALFQLIQMKKLDLKDEWSREWSGQVVLNNGSSCSAGMGLLFSKSFLPVSIQTEEIVAGRVLKVRAVFEKTAVMFVCVYMPSTGAHRLSVLDTV